MEPAGKLKPEATGRGEPGALAHQVHLLAELTQSFALSTEVDVNLQRAADATLDFLSCEAASVFLLEPDGETLLCHASAGPVPITGLRLPKVRGIIGRTLASGESQMVRDVRNDPDFNQRVDHDTGFATRSAMCTPLRVREQVLGVLQVLNKRGGDGLFSEPDLDALRVLGASAAFAIHTASVATDLAEQKRIRRELELALELQQQLLPPPLPPPFPLAGANLPALEVSGDFYDYYALADGRLAFTIGDVSGKGLNAALLMVRATSLLRIVGRRGVPPSTLLARVNRELCETGTRGMFVCVLAGIFDPKTTRVRLASAGFPPAIYRAFMGKTRLLGAQAPPLGVVPDANFPEQTLPLGPGALYMCTDGVTEARDAQQQALGEGGLLKLIEQHAALALPQRLHALMQDLQKLQLRDDTTLLVLDAGDILPVLAKVEIPARPERLRELRVAVAEAAQIAGCGAELTKQLVLAVDEASSNIIRHAYCGACDQRIELQIEQAGPELIFKLRDYAAAVEPGRLQPKPRSRRQPGGLGLHFIASIMDHWVLKPPPDGHGNLLVMTRRIR